jgi:fibronectin-binding autotransporter adhesin
MTLLRFSHLDLTQPDKMKLRTYPNAPCSSFARQAVIALKIGLFLAVPTLLLIVATDTSLGAQLIWDAGTNTATAAASGNWDTTAANTVWYTGAADVAWTQTSTTAPLNGATFNGPDAALGTYMVSVDAGQVAVTNLAINNSGYTFSGANAIYVGANDTLSLAANKTVTFNCNLAGSGTSPFWTLGSGATMNVGGNITSGQQVRLAGAAGSAFNLTGTNAPSIMFVLGSVNVTSGSLIPSASFYIGYPFPGTINGVPYTSGTLTVSGSSTVTVNGNVFIIGRSGGSGALTIGNGGAVNVGIGSTARALAIVYDGNAADSGTVNVYGGTLTVGSPSLTASTSAIDFFDTGEAAGATATMIQTNGVVFAWGGILFGAASGTAGSATLINSGGTLYLGKNGMLLNTVPPSLNITLSGGTVGALANWPSSVPMTLGTTNGNITFQCADNNNSPFSISLSGALTGAGGLNVAGGGTLTLSGSNNFTGTTVVSNGTLAIVTGPFPTNGPVTLDGSAGTPALTVESNPGQFWTLGTLTFASGSPTANFQFGLLSPSTSVAPVHVGGNVAFAVTPSVNVLGSAIAVGTYPMIAYTGSVSGTVPGSATVTLSGGSASGYVTNFTATKTISLVVTSSTYNPALYWRVGNGVWDINTSSNWTQFGNAVTYADGDAVIFDDSASGPSPITVSVNTTVNPLAITFNNMAPTNYTISGSRSISGSASLSLLGSGTATLNGTNTYTGGTVINAGQLNINNGGTSNATAIGTGPLTINSGAAIDNTSGSDVTLQASISETWNGNFTYLGSANNFNTGPGNVTMAANTAINVISNGLTVGATITDNGGNFQLSKTGNGSLTLPVGNNFNGGLTLNAGLLNLGDPNAAGQGVFTINGGAIDNVSGAGFTLTPASYIWGGNFAFLGTTSLALMGTIVIPNGLGNITVNLASNTLITLGDIVNNNTRVIKTGNGTWEITGSASSSESLALVVNAGQVNLHKTSGQAIQGGNNLGLTVQANALVLDENSDQIHSDTAIPVPVVLSGGVWDLNGWNENVDQLIMSSGGTLRNGAPGSTSILDLISGYAAMLSGSNCQFNVVAPDGVLNLKGVLGGTGSLVKTGSGTLILSSNNVYTGNTIISNGTVALRGVSSISNTAGINLAARDSVLDLSANTDTNGSPTPTLVLQSGQILSGFGSVTGLVATLGGATIAPGFDSSVGSLTVTGIVPGTNTLGGITAMKLDKGNRTNDQLLSSGSLVYGGTLALTNLSGSLTVTDSFVLFSAAGGFSGAFANITPSQPSLGLAWNTNNLPVNGTLSITNAPIPPSPTITAVSLAGATLTLQGTNGPATEPFVVLQSTNVALALTNWVPVLTNAFDGSGNFNVSIGLTNTTPQAFFRLSAQ